MPYNISQWRQRMRHRTDMSTYVYHLTRKTDSMSVVDVLLKILKERKLIGSTTSSGFVIGQNPAVCFQDVPLSSLCQNTLYEEMYRKELGGKVRYQPVGLGFTKKNIFHKGGRPVIYEASVIAKRILPEDEWWRIVNFHIGDANNMQDWTHEREWRVKGDMTFQLYEATVLLTKGEQYREFMEKADKEILSSISGVVVLDPVLS
ncbi:DUF2971 domain-containing protein [Paenibacillus sp. USHLN196]|uniref:DUF2971 domain-containing protein n=1 Tax=Paenibacillus sp. USHLN196 TaxID=3081291 RepID=UPI003017B222